jgi:predicted lysophospholipase L1 biosynthesis ABC-type transport system permease subunit
MAGYQSAFGNADSAPNLRPYLTCISTAVEVVVVVVVFCSAVVLVAEK